MNNLKENGADGDVATPQQAARTTAKVSPYDDQQIRETDGPMNNGINEHLDDAVNDDLGASGSGVKLLN